MTMSGSAGLLNKFYFFYLGSPKVGGAGDGKHKKNTATLIYTVSILLEARRLIEVRPHCLQLCALDKIIETALLYN